MCSVPRWWPDLVLSGGGGALWAPSAPTSEPAPSRVEHLLDVHDCWSGAAPAEMRHRIPGHVVVTTRRGRTVYGDPRLVGKALDQEFAHKRAGLTIHGFCR